jgi:Fe-S cluster biogenesis protein NfuA
MKTYVITVSHDHGSIDIQTIAQNIESAISIIMACEGCPRCAIGAWRIIPTKKQIAKTQRLLTGIG